MTIRQRFSRRVLSVAGNLLLLCTLTHCSLPAFGQIYPGNYTGYSASGNAVTVQAEMGALRFVFYRPDVIRVDYLLSPSTVFDSSLVVVQDSASGIVPSILENDSLLSISAHGVRVSCLKRPLRARFFDQTGRLLLSETEQGGFSSFLNERNVAFLITPDEHYYGTGERGTAMDRKGQAFSSYNTQQFGYSSPLPTMNLNVPFVASSMGYGIYFENTYPGKFDFGQFDPSVFSYSVEGGELSYYFMAAPTVPGQLELYTWLTGRQPLPPRWALGFIQSRFGYASEMEARSVVQTMRQKQIPCDAIVLDLYWFSQMGDLAWNLAAWPTPFAMMREFSATGIKTVVITEPYITERSANFPGAVAMGVLAKNTQGDPYLLSGWWSCNCNAGLIDLTSPAAREWWWDKHPQFFGSELAGIWTDLGEPERHPADMVHAMGSQAKVHNIYNLLWAQTIFEGFSRLRPGQRLFNLTRSGYAGIQRYGAIPWSGDVGRTFGGLAVQLPMMLSMGLSGLGYHNSDIGGFAGGSGSAELYVRWMQYGTFCPITRAHGTGAPTEPWGYGALAESLSVKYIRLRYRLLPYIYTLAHENYATGKPLARPLFFEEPGNGALAGESSSYLWGDAFVVSPVVQQGATTRSVTLPAGKWVNYWTDQIVDGGRTFTVPAPLETLPLFVRSGSVIPMQPLMQYSDERPLDTLMVAVYPFGGIGGTFTLYEDDGKTLAYQSGAFAKTVFSHYTYYDDGGRSFELLIGPASGSYDGKPERRTYLADVHGISGKPEAVWVNLTMIPERSSYDSLRKAESGYFFDAAAARLHIQVPTVPDSSYRILALHLEVTDVPAASAAPDGFELYQNYPNPFNGRTVVSSRYSVASHVKLAVYDLLGREVKVLVDEWREAGRYQDTFSPNGGSSSGGDASGLASGIYICRLTAGGFVAARKMLFMK